MTPLDEPSVRFCRRARASRAGRERRVLADEDQYLLGGGPRTGALVLELVRDLHPSTANTEGTP